MFKNFSKIDVLKNPEILKKKNISISNIIIELFYQIQSLWTFGYKKVIKIFQPFVFKNLKHTTEIKVIEKKSKKKKRSNINRILFYTRENFYESIFTRVSTLIHIYEWIILYFQLIVYKKTYEYRQLQNHNYIREKNLHKLFNSKGNTSLNEKNFKILHYKNLYWGFISFWNVLKFWVFSLTFFLLSFYVLLLKRLSVLPQTLFFWIGASMLLYWLLSGFVFFVKKYQFSRYTSVIQRFWRRSYILFWLIESGLLLVFFYLTVNSSQESFYMFDQGYFFKSHLFSWKIFIPKCILVVALITYSYLILLNLKWNTFNKNIVNLTALSILLIYLVWSEFYQIYWVSNFYANFFWLYDSEEAVWSLEWDARRTRIVNHYIMVLFLLKFWHIIFIFGCWVFFLLRSNESDTVTYPLFSFNFQNFLILFIMMWLFMYPWFKHTFRWMMEIPYYWFYVDTHTTFYRVLVYDLISFYTHLISNFFINSLSSYTKIDFISWNLFTNYLDNGVFIKSTIRDRIVETLI